MAILGSLFLPPMRRKRERAALRQAERDRQDQERIDLLAQVTTLLVSYMRDARVGDVEGAFRALVQDVRLIEWERAEKKAKDLLYSHLTASQRESYEELDLIRVKGKSNLYRIDARSARVYVEKPMDAYLCITTTDNTIPTADAVLGTKLFIEANEAEFLRIANVNGNLNRKLTIDGKIVNAKGKEVRGDPRGGTGDLVFERLQARLGQGYPRYVEFNQPMTPIDVTTFGDTARTYLTGTTVFENHAQTYLLPFTEEA